MSWFKSTILKLPCKQKANRIVILLLNLWHCSKLKTKRMEALIWFAENYSICFSPCPVDLFIDCMRKVKEHQITFF